MVDDSERAYVTVGQFETWLRRMLCKPLRSSSTLDCDYWETKTGVVFPVARPEATAEGVSVRTPTGLQLAHDRRYVLEILNHVVGIYGSAAEFQGGNVFGGEPAVKLVRTDKQ